MPIFASTKRKIMKEQFVPYELALELKKLGFDEPSVCVFNRDRALKSNIISNAFGDKITRDNYDVRLNAPLWQQAFDWFREKYKYHSYIGGHSEEFISNMEGIIEGQFNYFITHLISGGDTHMKYYKSYEEARQACLKKLIELCKNK